MPKLSDDDVRQIKKYIVNLAGEPHKGQGKKLSNREVNRLSFNFFTSNRAIRNLNRGKYHGNVTVPGFEPYIPEGKDK